MNDNLQSERSTIKKIDVCAFLFENFYCITRPIIAKKFLIIKKALERDQKQIQRLFSHHTKVQKRSRDLQIRK
jgi:hypothetical protein